MEIFRTAEIPLAVIYFTVFDSATYKNNNLNLTV